MRITRLPAAAVLVVLVIAPAASAHDHRPPQATLLVGGERQRGHSYHADWARRDRSDPEYCIATFAHGFPIFGRAVGHSPGQTVVVRLDKAAPPLEVEAYRWSRVTRKGEPKGPPHPLPWSLRPHQVGGEIRAWDVVVGWPATLDHLYLGIDAYWADEEGCGGFPDLGSQYAAWTFHLKAH